MATFCNQWSHFKEGDPEQTQDGIATNSKEQVGNRTRTAKASAGASSRAFLVAPPPAAAQQGGGIVEEFVDVPTAVAWIPTDDGRKVLGGYVSSRSLLWDVERQTAYLVAVNSLSKILFLYGSAPFGPGLPAAPAPIPRESMPAAGTFAGSGAR